jgi:hypothetical protein
VPSQQFNRQFTQEKKHMPTKRPVKAVDSILIENAQTGNSLPAYQQVTR